MGNLTEELESGGVNNCSMLKHNKNQNYVRNLFIPKFSKKDFVIYHQNVRGLNSNKIEELSVYLQIFYTLYALQNIISVVMKQIQLHRQIPVWELNLAVIHLKMEE